jgi:hypothetical protein
VVDVPRGSDDDVPSGHLTAGASNGPRTPPVLRRGSPLRARRNSIGPRGSAMA